MMKLNYDQQTDSLYIDLSANPGVDSEILSDDIVLDIDKNGDPVGIDIQHANGKTDLTEFIAPNIPKKVLELVNAKPSSKVCSNKKMESCLDFEVHGVPLVTAFGEQMADMSNFKALVRTDTNQTLAVVGEDYTIVQNSEIFKQVADGVGEEIEGSFKTVDELSHDGKICYRRYKFDDLTLSSSSESKSDLHFQIIAQNSFGSRAIKLYIGAVDFFCTNGMIIGSFTSNYWRHSKNLDIDDLKKEVSAGVKGFRAKGREWARWQKRRITFDQAESFIAKLNLSDLRKGNLRSRFEHETRSRGSTLWALYSAMTYYASHDSLEFPVKATKNDHKATTLMNRAEEVRRWSESERFKQLAAGH